MSDFTDAMTSTGTLTREERDRLTRASDDWLMQRVLELLAHGETTADEMADLAKRKGGRPCGSPSNAS